MNEEQKEAIKTIESFKNIKWYSNIFPRGVEILTEEERREIDIVINLIEKQQKEIEDLKAITREYDAYELGEGNKIMIATKEWFNNGYFEEHYISKDKIRDIIFEFIPKSNHEVELRTKIIKLLGE